MSVYQLDFQEKWAHFQEKWKWTLYGQKLFFGFDSSYVMRTRGSTNVENINLFN